MGHPEQGCPTFVVFYPLRNVLALVDCARLFSTPPVSLLLHSTHIYLRRSLARVSTLFVLALLLLCSVPALRGQDSSHAALERRIELGLVGEVGAGVQGGSFSIYPGFPGCGLFERDGLNVVQRGLGGTLRLPQIIADNLGLAAIAQLEWSDVDYSARPLDAQRIIDDATGTIVQLDREFRFETSTTMARLELGLLWQPVDHLSLSVGPSLGLLLNSAARQTDNILGPADRSFADGERQRAMPRGFDPVRGRFGLGGTLRATWRIPLPPGFSERLSLLPGLVLGGDILGTEQTFGWRSLHLGAMLGLVYNLTPGPDRVDTLPPPDTVRRDTVVLPAGPVASLLFTGVDDNDRSSADAVVMVTTVVRRRFTPMLPLVYFDSGASTPAARYTRIDADSARRFSILPLARVGPFVLSHHILNLVGWRWRERGRPAKVILYGAASEGESPSLARARARYVADYLTGVWRIPKRLVEVRTEAGPIPLSTQMNDDGRAENRRVLVASDDPDLLGPLEVEQSVRDFNPPRIRLEPKIEAAAGLRDWTIVLRQRNVELARFALRDSSTGSRTWRLLDGSIDSALNVLEAELVAEDSLGRTARASAQLTLRTRRDTGVIESRRQQRGERERLEWGLVGFGFRESEGTERHILELTDLAALAGDTVMVDAAGTTDRVGDEESNRLLSQRRAEWAVARLRALLAGRGVTVVEGSVRGLGVDATRFPNEYPEGRVLSRGVTVGIEQEADAGKR